MYILLHICFQKHVGILKIIMFKTCIFKCQLFVCFIYLIIFTRIKL